MRDAHRAHGPVYSYLFGWPAREPALGACHGIDIPFTFGNFVDGWAEFVGARRRGARARRTRCATRGPSSRATASRAGRPRPATMRFDRHLGRRRRPGARPARVTPGRVARRERVARASRRSGAARGRARVDRRATRRPARRARPRRRGARVESASHGSMPPATRSSRQRSRSGCRSVIVAVARATMRRRELGRAQRFGPGERAARRSADRRRPAPPPRPRRCRADRSTRCARRRSACTNRPRRSSAELALQHRREERRLQHGRRDRRRRRAGARSRGGCRAEPSSRPAIGMLEIFTMCSTPARSAASMPFVSSVTWSRVGELTRNSRCAPANARSSDVGIGEVGGHELDAVGRGVVEAPADRAHGDAARRRARARPPRRADRFRRSRRTVTRSSLPHRDYRGDRARAPTRTGHRPRADRPAAARVRAAHPRRRGLEREPRRPHLVVHARRRHVDEPVGHLVGRGARVDSHPARRRRQRRRGRLGRHRRGLDPHRAAPRAPRRHDHRAQPPVLRDVARGDGRAAADGAPEQLRLPRRARVRRRVRARRR